MTPDDLARLKALAEAARDASDAYAHICATAPTWTDEASRLSDAEDDALEDLHEVATPAAILALIAAASPVPAGEFGERLEPVYGEPWACRKVSGAPPAIFHLERIVACVNACAGIADPAYFLAALTRSHATLLAERDAARAACAALVAWFDSEDRGPAYPEGMTRDSPGGENVWRGWWEENLQLCDRAGKLARAALETTP